MRPTTSRAPLDLRIELLRLSIRNAAGHEHRLGQIAARAAAILAEHLAARGTSGRSGPTGTTPLAAAPVRVDLGRMSNDALAHEIAGAWLAGLTPGPRGDRADVRARTSSAWSP